ncbi:MAG: cytoplasmic filament protein CfpA [Deltaproteobacteria bacterium]|nr:cytoplasmic filament protein CfpA [Deltaproteobacteria bacterium]
MPSDFNKGPNQVHPETPSAVGSRNSTNRDGRDEYVESRMVIDEEIDKILNHVESKLPPEVLEDITVQGNVKSHLHKYFNQTLQNMLSRYLSTTEDEMAKKVRDLIDKDEHKTLNRYTPREISELVNNVGGPELFNTEEVEKSVVNIMGHLQGHAQRGVYEFETATNSLLLQKTDVGGFIGGHNTFSVVKCSLRDNFDKPEEVVDIRLAINVLDSEMISPVIRHQILTEHLVKDIIAKHIHTLVDREIDEINQQLNLEGRAELSQEESIFEKIKAVENYTDDDETENSKRYRLLPKQFLDQIKNLDSEVKEGIPDIDPLSMSNVMRKVLDGSHIRTRGWHTAVTNITTILDQSRMGYQHIENYKHSRHMVIREYEETTESLLPDERYQIEMKYFDAKAIREAQAAYSIQMAEFKREIMRLWNVVEAVYKEEKARNNSRDWNDVVSDTLERGQISGGSSWFQPSAQAPADEVPERLWDEVTYIQRELTSLEEMNRTYEEASKEFKARFKLLRKRLTEIFELRYPNHRLLIEQRLKFLEAEFIKFNSKVNPYHLQPGMLLDIELTSIKRRRVTIKGMSNVLNEFLLGISKGYSEEGPVGMEHRRSNVEENIGSFAQH